KMPKITGQKKCPAGSRREKIRNKCIIFGYGKETKQTKIHASADYHSDTFGGDSYFQSQCSSLRMVHAAHLPCGSNYSVHAFRSFSLFNLRPVYHSGNALSDRADAIFNPQENRFKKVSLFA